MGSSANKADTAKSLTDLIPFELYYYASYIPNRTNGSGWSGGENYKRHKTYAHAQSAITAARSNGRHDISEAKIFEWDTEKRAWVDLAYTPRS